MTSADVKFAPGSRVILGEIETHSGELMTIKRPKKDYVDIQRICQLKRKTKNKSRFMKKIMDRGRSAGLGG